MKNIFLFTLLMSSLACSNGLQFSKTETSKLGGDGPGDCIGFLNSGDGFQAPAEILQVGDVINLKHPSVTAFWFVELPDGSKQQSQGETNFSVEQVGLYKGILEAIDACNNIQVFNFQFQAVPAIGATNLVINNGAQYTSESQVSLALLAENATEMYISEDSTCSSGGVWQPLTNQLRWNLKAENYNANVYAKFKNLAGRETGCISDAIIHDNIAPTIAFTSTPKDVANSSSAEFVMSVSDNFSGVDLQFCQIDGGNVNICGQNVKYNNLSDGGHSFAVRVSDKAGNQSNWLTYAWTIDTVKPTLRFTKVPANPTNLTLAEFAFSAEDKGSGIASLECNANQAGFSLCNSPLSLNVVDGSNNLQVRAMDVAGNISDIISYTWFVDTIGPEISITNMPTNPTKLEQTQFNFNVSDVGVGLASVVCQIDSSPAAPCENQVSYFLTDGMHEFKISAKDKLGNSSEKSYSWLIDTKTQNEDIEVPVGVVNQRDILFVIDTSKSMDAEIVNFRKEFKGLSASLRDINWNLSITSAFVKDYAQGTNGTLGEIIKNSNNPYVINKNSLGGNEEEIDKTLVEAIEKMPSRFTYIEPIHAARLVLSNPDYVNTLRKNAHLDIVIFTDSDERVNKSKRPENIPENFLTFMQQMHPDKSYKVSALANRPGEFTDRYCYREYGDRYADYVMKLVGLAGGFSGNICGRMVLGGKRLLDALSLLGEPIIPPSYIVDLKCEPENQKVDVTFLDPVDPATVTKVEGKKLSISPYPDEGVRLNLYYRCK